MTKKVILFVTILGLLALSLSSVAPALAAEPLRGGPGGGRGGSGGAGGNGNQGSLGSGSGVPVQQNINLDGALEEYLHTNLAVALGLDPAELTARLDGGETLAQIALSLGFDAGSLSSLLTEARSAALAAAVSDGLITQAQADWLASRGNFGSATGGNAIGAGLWDGTCTYDGSPQLLMDGSGKTAAKGYMQKSGR